LQLKSTLLKRSYFWQAKINESLTKKLLAIDETQKSINIKVKNLSSSLENQLSYNKMIKTQLAQIADDVLVSESRRIPVL